MLSLIIEDFDFDFNILLDLLKRLRLNFTPLNRIDIKFLLDKDTIGFDSISKEYTKFLLSLGSPTIELDNIKFRSLLLDLDLIVLDFDTSFSLSLLNRVGLHLTILDRIEKTFLLS